MGARLATHTCGRPDPSLHANSATQRHASRTQRDTTRTQQTGSQANIFVACEGQRRTTAAGDAQPHPIRDHRGHARGPQTTTPTLMACGFRTREGAGLCCRFDNVPGTATPAWTCSMQHGGRGGCRLRQRRRIHANNPLAAPPPHLSRFRTSPRPSASPLHGTPVRARIRLDLAQHAVQHTILVPVVRSAQPHSWRRRQPEH